MTEWVEGDWGTVRPGENVRLDCENGSVSGAVVRCNNSVPWVQLRGNGATFFGYHWSLFVQRKGYGPYVRFDE